MRSEPTRILVLGGTGLLGGAVLAQARGLPGLSATWRHRTPPAPDPRVLWRRLDLLEPGAADRIVRELAPGVVLHAAISVRPGEAEAVIVGGSRAVAEAARATGAAMIHVSSDMVFDGASGPFDESARPSPITDYGRAKAAAERAVRDNDPDSVIVRCPLLYRLDPPDRSLATWLAGLERGDAYPLFTDEIRCPAQVDDVARALLELARRVAPDAAGRDEVPRTLHLVGPRALSRHAFGRLVLGALGMDQDLATPAISAASSVPRPRELVLRTGGTPAWLTAFLRPPEEALRRA